MSNGTGPEKKNIYFGSGREFYEPDRFDAFVRREVAPSLGNNGRLNTEGKLPNIIYHFPDASIGIRYDRINEHRCVVNLLWMHGGRNFLSIVQELIFLKDNES